MTPAPLRKLLDGVCEVYSSRTLLLPYRSELFGLDSAVSALSPVRPLVGLSSVEQHYQGRLERILVPKKYFVTRT